MTIILYTRYYLLYTIYYIAYSIYILYTSILVYTIYYILDTMYYILLYYILYTIYYILYSIYYILYAIYYTTIYGRYNHTTYYEYYRLLTKSKQNIVIYHYDTMFPRYTFPHIVDTNIVYPRYTISPRGYLLKNMFLFEGNTLIL